MTERYTRSGVRLREYRGARGTAPAERAEEAENLNWLLFPGGPGLGSESVRGLAELVPLPGTTWLVDLPGDGSNVPAAPGNPYLGWPGVLLEAVEAVPNSIVVGHSTGGMYLLSVPELEQNIAGLVLVSSAPDARWLKRLEAGMEAWALSKEASAGLQAADRYERNPSDRTLGELTLATAEWSFESDSLAAARRMLRDLPYNNAATTWSGEYFDPGYRARWWPSAIPTLILSGDRDRVVDQELWDDPAYGGSNVERVMISGAAHFPWFENPNAVATALAAFGRRVTRFVSVS